MSFPGDIIKEFQHYVFDFNTLMAVGKNVLDSVRKKRESRTEPHMNDYC